MKNSVKKTWNVISTILVVIVVVIALLLVGARVFGLQVYAVLSGSMEPTYHVGSIIYVKFHCVTHLIMICLMPQFLLLDLYPTEMFEHYIQKSITLMEEETIIVITLQALILEKSEEMFCHL